MRRFGTALAAMLLVGAVLAAATALAHTLPASFARSQSQKLMNQICHENYHPCHGVQIQQCSRKSAHRVDCKAALHYAENGVNKTCRASVTSRLSGNTVTTHVLRATVRCRPD
jgi:hypothetical protein